jgi:uncharacterized membrane protein YphA (DoxX/SURF4 family)
MNPAVMSPDKGYKPNWQNNPIIELALSAVRVIEFKMKTSSKNIKWAAWFLRIALSVDFLSAVADRFGFWGPAGSVNVAWGNWSHFLDYVAALNGYAPSSFIPVLGVISTIAEVVFALGLLAGWKLRWFSLASGILLLLFSLAMTFSTGIKTAFDASVYAASAGAFVLSTIVDKDFASITRVRELEVDQIKN